MALPLLVPPGVRAQPQIPAPAQVPMEAREAVLSGTVADSTGAMLPKAALQLAGKGRQVSGETGAQGTFSFHLPPGEYVLTVEAPGFAPFTSSPLLLRAGSSLRLPVRLLVAGLAEQVDAAEDPLVSGMAEGGYVFSGKALDLFSDDDQTLLRQLRALTGGVTPSILVNGFSSSQLPPKSSIRSIRVNNNEFSALYDSFGFGRVEIDTQPGADKLHGEINFSGTDKPLNASNPYTGVQPPYYQFLSDAEVNGPLSRRMSFFASEQVQLFANNAVVNAADPAQRSGLATVSEALPAPQRTDNDSLRIDRQFSEGNFAFIRDQWTQTHTTNSGIEPLVLPSAAYGLNSLTNTLQVADTQSFGAHAVNQVRFQYLRTRVRQDPDSTAPAVIAEGSFVAGGSNTQVLRDNRDDYELQQEFDLDRGPHSLRTGLRLRAEREANTSSANFNGQFVFPSLGAYQATLTGLAAGETPAQIRAAGGGASQFNVTTGNPSALVYTDDFALFGEDTWRVRPDLTLSYGLRLESQSAIPDHLDPAPRASLRWAPRRPNRPLPPIVVSAGYGLFYTRFSVNNLLQAVRQNGVGEVASFVQNPDFYPNVPPPATLPASEPTIYRVDPGLHTSYQQMGSVTVTRPLPNGAIQAKYIYSHGTHGYLSRNLNAPLPGTSDPGNPGGGTRPLGTAENLYQYSSAGNSNSSDLLLRSNLQFSRITFYAEYIFEHSYNESTYDPVTGLTGFPSNQYNVAADYGRASDMTTHRSEISVTWNLPRGFFFNPYMSTHSGTPFDITTGADNNGDTIYNDRPALATDLSRPSVVRTALGNFDTDPLPGQAVIPRNYGTNPAFFYLETTAGYAVHMGRRPAQQPGDSSRPERPYTLRLQADVQNLTNHNNPGPRVGVLSSPEYFGRSLSLATDFSTFSASNRTILLQSRFSF